MGDTTINLGLDLSALEAEVGAMSQEDIAKQLLEVRTKQRVQQKKYHNKDKAKAYQQKRNAQTKLMAEKAKSLPAPAGSKAKNLYEHIMLQAAEAADAKIAAEAADSGEGAEVEEVVEA